MATSDKQIKRIQRYHGLAITHNVLSTSNPSDSEINIAVYTMKKNLISILHHSIQAGDSAKQLRFSPPDKNSWFDWQQEHWQIKGWLLAPGFCGIVTLHPHNVKLHRTEMSASILWFGFSAQSINVMMWKYNSLCCGFCSVTILSWNCKLPKKSSKTTIFSLKHFNFHWFVHL